MGVGKKTYAGAFALITMLFFMWGFMTVVNDVVIPHLKSVFVLSFAQSQLVNSAFFGAYFVGSVAYFIISRISGDPINKIGYKNGIILGLLISALGSVLFYPATIINAYWFYLMALFIVGLGFTMLQIAANPYVAILGEPETASSRLNLSQGFNSLGTTLGALLGGYLIFKYFAGPDAVKYPYLIFTGILILLAILIKMAELPTFSSDEKTDEKATKSALSFPHLRFGMLAIFAYVGAEVAVGSLLIIYFGLPEIAGLPEDVADNFLSLYWGGMMLGRFVGFVALSEMKNPLKKYGSMLLMAGAICGLLALLNGDVNTLPILLFAALNFIGFIIGKSLPGRTLAVFALIAAGLLFTTINTTGQIAFWSVIAVGAFNSIMWPNIFTLSIAGLGKSTSQGSSLLVMMILGGALIPPFQGWVVDLLATPANPTNGLQTSFYVPLLCYLYIAFFGLVGCKIGRKNSKV